MKRINHSWFIGCAAHEWEIWDGGTPGHVRESASSFQCVRRSSVLCVILIGRIRESADQHFSSRDGRGVGVEEGVEEARRNDYKV